MLNRGEGLTVCLQCKRLASAFQQWLLGRWFWWFVWMFLTSACGSTIAVYVLTRIYPYECAPSSSILRSAVILDAIAMFVVSVILAGHEKKGIRK